MTVDLWVKDGKAAKRWPRARSVEAAESANEQRGDLFEPA